MAPLVSSEVDLLLLHFLLRSPLTALLTAAPTSRRCRQNMGWTPNGKLWLTTRGGDLLLAPSTGVTEEFDETKFNSRGQPAGSTPLFAERCPVLEAL